MVLGTTWQLEETWERADRWIADDLGVSGERVRSRRNELVAELSFTVLPEKVWARDGKEYEYAERKKLRGYLCLTGAIDPAQRSRLGRERPSKRILGYSTVRT